MVVECYASLAAMDTHIDRMFSVSQQPTDFYNCQRSQLDTLTLYLTSVDSFNTAVGHASICRTHTHLLLSSKDTHTSLYSSLHPDTALQPNLDAYYIGKVEERHRAEIEV